MKSSRRSLAIAAVALAPLVLAGCEKPNPGVTVWSGTNSEHVEALCWQHREVGGLSATDCAESVLQAASQGQNITPLAVTPGDVVGVSVDPIVAENGWSVQISGRTLASGLTDTYFRFTFPETILIDLPTDGSGLTLQVIAAAKPNGARGYWFYQLIPS